MRTNRRRQAVQASPPETVVTRGEFSPAPAEPPREEPKAPSTAPPARTGEISARWWLAICLWVGGFLLLFGIEMIQFIVNVVQWLIGG